jgi:dTDP-L-rhamnose 4-epimerase
MQERGSELAKKKILVTGGAGFIGSHIVDLLLERGHEVTVYDSLEEQVHGRIDGPPEYLNPEARFIRGDVCDRESLAKALQGQEIVYHEAAAVGVGQSMYEIARYTRANSLGGAVLLDLVVNTPSIRDTVEKLIVASSMSIYGEGAYRCAAHGVQYPGLRPLEQISRGEWELKCPVCGEDMTPIGTPEEKPLQPTSIYAVSKRDHEEMFLAVGRAYNIPTVAFRYFNVYGPRQALSNPYTGVAAIFSGRLLNGNPPVVYEDGLQSRDFIHVRDIARANLLAAESSGADYNVVNLGSGRNLSILEIAEILSRKLQPGKGIEPEVVNRFRRGDIRHCYADTRRAEELLGFRAEILFEDGIEDLTDWVSKQQAEDRFEQARLELEKRGLTS